MSNPLFRGKRTDNGEWVHGYYVAANYSWHKHGVHRDWIVTASCSNGGWFSIHGRYPVVADTVGQFTGLTDKNGKKIFEGDIVKYVKDGYVATGVARFGLYASAGAAFAGHEGFYLDWAGCDWLRKDIGFWATMRPIEVIGNIHDTPELLEEAQHAE